MNNVLNDGQYCPVAGVNGLKSSMMSWESTERSERLFDGIWLLRSLFEKKHN